MDSADKVLSLEFISKAPIASPASGKPVPTGKVQELKNMLDTNLISDRIEQKKRKFWIRFKANFPHMKSNPGFATRN